jgi:hypothetical protein
MTNAIAAPSNPAAGISQKQATATVPVVTACNGNWILKYLAEVITKRNIVAT